MDTLRKFWNAIPAPLRTIINVVLGAVVAALANYIATTVSDGSFDINAAWQVVLAAFSTALVRALNPLDQGTSAYGFGSDPTDV